MKQENLMKKYLLDLVKATKDLEFDKIRITGTDEETKIESYTEDKNLIMKAVTKQPVPEMKGVFGLSNLKFLYGLTSLSCYRSDDAEVRMSYAEKNGKKIPEEIIFDSKEGSVDHYRLVAESVVPKQITFNEKTWDITVKEPKRDRIHQFGSKAALYSDIEDKFLPKTKKGDLIFYLGDPGAANHKGEFTFAEGVGDGLKDNMFSWKVSKFISIMRLAENADCSLQIVSLANAAVMQIKIDTGITDYTFIMPGYH